MSKSRAAIWAASLVLGLGMAVAVNPAGATPKEKDKAVDQQGHRQAAAGRPERDQGQEMVGVPVATASRPTRRRQDCSTTNTSINELLGFCAIRINDYATAAKALEAGLNSGFLEQDQVPSRVRALAQVNYQIKNYAKAIEFGNKRRQGRLCRCRHVHADCPGLLHPERLQEDAAKFVGDWIADQEKRGQTPREERAATVC